MFIQKCCGNCDKYKLKVTYDEDGYTDEIYYECYKIKTKPVRIDEPVDDCPRFKVVKRLSWQEKLKN